MSSPTDPTPLLSPSGRFPTRRLPSLTLRGAVRFLQRNTTNRRTLSDPSMLVREAAAEQLDERQGDWAYSKPVVILDTLWNLVFVVGAVGVFAMSWHEKPGVPLRLWIAGYALQCILHVVCVVVEYRRRIARRRGLQFWDGDSEQNRIQLHVLPLGPQYAIYLNYPTRSYLDGKYPIQHDPSGLCR